MTENQFRTIYSKLTENQDGHFPWQWQLYQEFESGLFRPCNLPTGLGKTSVIALWLIALAHAPVRVPRRLVYVVNRRTVVDQSTREAEKLRHNLTAAGLSERLAPLCALPADPPIAISTLRGQFADNREWSADPSRPAVIVGTVDMIGSRLLFSGYGVGFKAKPLHAGFLGQDALLVHDEAHLEPAFQDLLIAIQKEQERCKEFRAFHVMELSATSRSGHEAFELTQAEREPPADIPDPPTAPIHHVWRRLKAKKTVALHEIKDEGKLADEIADLALRHNDCDRAVLVFVRKVEDVEKVAKRLPRGSVQQLTGTLRGLERDRMADPRREDGCPIFARFLKPPKPDAPEDERWKVQPKSGTVYLVCTSAGEVGVNISADHMVCDLSTFDSMAQRFGRVNRFGDCKDTCIDIVYPKDFDEEDDYDLRRKKTLELLRQLNSEGSPAALGVLDPKARIAAFAPPPIVLPTSDILFDAWALTTIRGKLPGRPMVEPYLHGVSGWELPETHVAWRKEVWELRLKFKTEEERKQSEWEGRRQLARLASELLEDYPLKAHELLRDNSSRVFDRLRKLAAPPETPAWIVSDDDAVEVTTLGEMTKAGKDDLSYKTVLLPPVAGGLRNGMLTSDSESADDVADELLNEAGERRRLRIWDDDPVPDKMRWIRTVEFPPPDGDEDAVGRSWSWYELPKEGDSDGSKSNRKPVLWQVHTNDVIRNAKQLVKKLRLSEELRRAIILAALWHDLGKKRELWQRSIGNRLPKDPKPGDWLAKSGGKMKPRELTDYRHEFGSLLDVLDAAGFRSLSDETKELVLHLIAVHHGYGRPHFPADNAFDPDPKARNIEEVAADVPRRFARLQRKYGRWRLAYLESLLRSADYAASAKPSAFVEERP